MEFEPPPDSEAEKKPNLNEVIQKLEHVEKELDVAKIEIEEERNAKNKIFSSLVKLAQELKQMKQDSDLYKGAVEYANKAWYEGGFWRSPEILPSVTRMSEDKSLELIENTFREPVSLTDLFMDLVIVTAFSRVGDSVQNQGRVNGESVAYFAVFWLIWLKEASYSTRFDTSDLSSQIETLVTCFAVLFGCLSTANTFDSEDSSRIMMVAAFVALLHFFLHLRVALCHRFAEPDTDGFLAKRYAHFIMGMTAAEFVVWMIGIFLIPVTSNYRWVVFLIGILLSLRVPKAFLANDFHAACSKRGVLFILLLGFTLQSTVLVAAPFFDQMSPTTPQYVFLGCDCLLLFCIKLLYVNDTGNIDPKDHALLVNRAAGFLFHCGQFCLLFSTTILGSGLDLITHSYMARTAILPNHAKSLVSGGFAAVIGSIFFIKSMHVRRVPINPVHERMFYVAYALQMTVHLAVVFVAAWICMDTRGHLAFLTMSEIELLGILSGSALVLVLISWLDEALELSLYGVADTRDFRVHPFGLWFCIQPTSVDEDGESLPLMVEDSVAKYRAMGLTSNLNLRPSMANLGEATIT